jgi:hypothetical protein
MDVLTFVIRMVKLEKKGKLQPATSAFLNPILGGINLKSSAGIINLKF